MSYYVIVRGPLGVGKTTVAGRLARRIGGEHLSIDRILDEEDLWESGRLCEFLRANRSAARRAQRLLGRGVPVVFDGNFYWKSQIADLLRRLHAVHRIFTLTAPLEVCLRRDRRRTHSYGPEATRAVYLKSTRFEYGIPVDATRDVREVIRELVRQLPAGTVSARG
jgi:predicted kinase